MPLGLLSDIAFSALGLLQGTLLTSMPVFVAVALLALVRSKIAARYSLSWIKSTALVTFVAIAVLVFLANYVPMLASLGEQSLGAVPAQLADNQESALLRAVMQPLRMIFVALALTLLLLPLGLIGDFIYAALNERWKGMNRYVWMFASVFLTVLVAMLFALIILPRAFGIDVITGVIYFVFVGTGG